MSIDISEWLGLQGLEQYLPNFVDNDIDLQLLVELTDADLKELGIVSLGHRKKLLSAIENIEDPGIAASMPEESGGEAERRQLTVMFCDLVGSTELSQKLDPEDLREVNRAYQDCCKTAIERYEGYVARYMGDGVLAYFGYPRAHEDDPERAILSGLDIVESMSALNDKLGALCQSNLAVRVGVATGPVVVGDVIGEGASQENAVVGETPNLAARLQGMAAIDTVVIGPSTFNLARGHFEYEDLGFHPLKGIAEPVQIRRVIAPSVSESRFEAMHNSALTPLVGRMHEAGLLFERWEYAKEGDGQVVFFSGEPGIGKSRITESLCAQIDADNPVVVRYQCSAYHNTSVLRPVIEQLERDAGIKASDSPSSRLEKLEQLISPDAPRMPQMLKIIANLLSIAPDDTDGQLDMAPEQLKEATLEALVTQVETCGRGRPILLVFEDAHWSDPTSLEFLGLLISRLQFLPLLLVITFRLEFTPPWDGPSYITSLRLNRLSRSRAINLIESVSGASDLPPEVREQIIEKADGVPLYLEELTKAVVETGTSGAEAAMSIPGTLHDSLMSRLDRSATMREVAQVAAVIGREFSFDLLASVSALGKEALKDALDLLEESALVFPRGPDPSSRYIFKHALVQDAAYESLLKVNRRSLHARIAVALEKEFPDLAASDPELLAYHYTEGGLEEPARRCWLKAGQRSIRQNAHSEAVSQLGHCLDRIDSITDDNARVRNEIEIRVALGVSLVGKEGGASSLVVENYTRAHDLCLQLDDTEHLYPVLWGLWFHHLMRSDLSRASELADRLLEFSEKLRNEALILEAHHCQWAVKYISGDLASAIHHCDAGTELYRPEKHHGLTHIYGGHDPGACALCVSGISLWLLGFPEQSLAKLDQADHLAAELDHTRSQANTLRMSLFVFVLSGDLDRVEQNARALLELAESDEMLDNLKLANGTLGWVRFCRGDKQGGMALMRESINLWRTQKTPWTAISISLGAIALGELGEVSAGLELIEDSIGASTGDDLQWTMAELYRVKAELLLKRDGGTPDEAETTFCEAIRIAKVQNAKSLELRAAVGLAGMLREQGKIAEARNTIMPVYNWFTEGLETPDLVQARQLVNDLA